MINTAKQHIILIVISTLLAGFSMACIIAFTNPWHAGIVTFVFLYISIFIATLGLAAMIGLGLRQWLTANLYILNLAASFRQGLLLAILVTGSLVLSAQDLLYWWVEASLILLLLALEMFLSLKI